MSPFAARDVRSCWSSRTRILRSGIWTLALIALMPACTKGGAGKSGKGAQGRRGGGPTAVRVETASRQVLPAMTSVVTSLSGRKQADVYTKVAGRLSFIGPKEGEAVKSGQVIFRVDRSDPGESFLSTPVVSPITGWVGRWYATSLGEQLTTSTPVVTVVDDEILRAVVELPTREWLLVNKETSAEVEVGGEKRTAKVVAVARSGSANSGRGSVTVEIENPGRTWRSGMVARVKLGLEPRPRMVIPSSALIMTDQGTFVYVADNGIARRTSIDFTMIDADSVEVTRGLDDGAVVIIAGTNLLSDQAPIRVVNGNEDGRRSE